MVSNAPGYARTRKNIRKNKAEFTSETTRIEKRHIIKSAQKAKRSTIGNFGSQKKTWTKEQAVKHFRTTIAPEIIKVYGKDNAAMRMEWNNYVDALNKEGYITDKQATTWLSPISQR